MITDSMEQLEVFLKGLPVAAFACSQDGKIFCYNQHAVALWGRVPQSGELDESYCGPLDLFQRDGESLPREQSPIAIAIETGSVHSAEFIAQRRDQTRIAVLANVQPIVDDEGLIRGALTVLTDVSAQRESELELKRVSEFRESIIRTAAEGICVCFSIEDFPYVQFSVWNNRMTEITGYTMEEINCLGWYQTMYPDEETQQRAQERMAQMRDGNDLRNEQWTITRKCGELRIVDISTSLVELKEGVPAVVALMQDVTDECKFKAAMLESEERLQLAVEATKLGPWDWDLVTNDLYLTPEWKQQLGYEQDELEGRYTDWAERLHPDDEDRVLKQLTAYIEGASPEYDLEFRMRHKDGSYRWIYTRGVVHRDDTGKPIRMLGCHLDITQRKRTEGTLRHILEAVASTTGREYFAKLVDYLCDVCQVELAMIAEVEPDNPLQAHTIAVSLGGKPVPSFSFALQGTPGETMWEEELSLHHHVQDEFPADEVVRRFGISSYLGIPLWSNSGRPIGLLALMHTRRIEDVEHAKSLLRVVGARSGAELERHRAEEAVRQSEVRLSSIAATMPQALYVFNIQTGQNEYQNRIVARDLGYSDEEMSEFGSDVLGALLHPEDQRKMAQLLSRWDNVEDGEVIETEYRMRHKSGQWRWYVGRDAVYERDSEGRIRSIIGTAQDITARREAEEERRRLEAQIQHSQKLESLGILTGGIAHDFNNLLTSVLSFADLSLASLPEDSQAANYVQEAIKGAKSAAELTAQMLAYSGKGKFDLCPIDISKVVSETSRLLQVSVSKHCVLDLDLADSLPLCDGDVSQLRQVIMNLIINASEAIGEDSGIISVSTSTESVTADESVTSFTGDDLEQGEYVVLEVTDTGCGMDEETMQKLFDPFFSTKFSGRGLGMSAVLGIVRGHHGAVQVQSQPGKGTTFRVFLPVSLAEADVQEQAERATATWKSEATILVADDEAVVLKSTVALLKFLGFQVVTSTDGQDAVEKFEAIPDDIDLVMLDLTMPRMDGSEACRRIRTIRPDVHIILMSGYNEESTSERFDESGPSGFLQKPFRIDALKDLLQQLLPESQ